MSPPYGERPGVNDTEAIQNSADQSESSLQNTPTGYLLAAPHPEVAGG